MPGKLRPVIGIGTTGVSTSALGGSMSNSATSGGSTDFDTRKSGPGVFRWFDFDTISQLGYQGDPNPLAPNYPNFGSLVNTGANIPTPPVIDTAIKASGTGSLRFDIVSGSDAASAGQWYANFSSDLSLQFGENTTFYVQWRQRFNQAFIDTYFLDTVGAEQDGIKQMILGQGDQVGSLALSHTNIELVVQTYKQHRFPRLYNEQADNTLEVPFEENYGGSGNKKLQNSMPSPYCLYWDTVEGGGTVGGTTTPAGCFGWYANEWMTFKIRVDVGSFNSSTNKYDNSRVRFWGAREGQPSTLLIDWNNTVSGYFPLSAGVNPTHQKYGKIWLLPYMTAKSTTQVHALCQTWYDELILSTQDIPDPTVYPAWRLGKVKDTIYSIPNTAQMANAGDIPNNAGGSPNQGWGKNYQDLDQSWSGPAFDEDGAVLYGVAMGGDKIQWSNKVVKCDLSLDQPIWSLLYHGTDPNPYPLGTGVPTNSIFPDGTPRAHQTYNHQYYNKERNAILMYYLAAPFGNIGGHTDVMRAFYLGTNKYDSAADGTGPWPSTQLDTIGNRICATMARDPVTGDVYGTSNGSGVFYWKNDATQFGTIYVQSVSGLSQWNFRHSCIDTLRKRWVYFMNGQMHQMDISTPTAITYVGATTCTGLHTGPNTGSPDDNLAFLTYGSLDNGGWYIAPVYDEFNDRFLLFTGDSNPGNGYTSTTFPGYIWFISPSGVVTDRKAITAPPNGWNPRVYLDRKHKCVVWISDYFSDFGFMPLVTG